MLEHLRSLPPAALALLAGIAGAIGAIVSAIITGILGKVLVTPLLSARDRQDREAEWRMHAIELTKLDLQRKLQSRKDLERSPLRPSILDFLANYRDLQELGSKSPKDLYETILAQRIDIRSPSSKNSKSDASAEAQ